MLGGNMQTLPCAFENRLSGAVVCYYQDGIYEALIKEGVMLEKMALLKFQEWIETESYADHLGDMHVVRHQSLGRLHRQWLNSRDPQARRAASQKLCEQLGLLNNEQLGLLNKESDESVAFRDLAEAPLVSAALEGSKWMLEMLLDAAQDQFEVLQRDGGRALNCAATVGHLEFVKSLLEKLKEKGLLDKTLGDTSNHGTTCLILAAGAGHADVALHLAKMGGRPLAMQTDVDGRSCVFMAARHGHVEVLKTLLKEEHEWSAELLQKTDKFGNSCVYQAAMHGHEDVLHFLLNDLCKNDHQCKSHICGRPLLKLRSEGQKQSCAYVASKYGRKKALEIMLNCQTDEEQKELLHGCLSDEVSCAHIAAKEGRADTLRFIIEREGKLLTEKTKDGRTCAHFAAQSGSTEMLQFVIEREGKLLTEKTKDGRTCAHFAARSGSITMLQFVIERERKLLTQTTDDGSTCRDFVRGEAKDFDSLRRYLEGHGVMSKNPPSSSRQSSNLSNSSAS